MKFLPALLLLALLPARVNAQSTTTTTTVVKQVTPTPDLRVLSLGVLQAPAVYALEAVAVRPAVVTEEAELDPEPRSWSSAIGPARTAKPSPTGGSGGSCTATTETCRRRP